MQKLWIPKEVQSYFSASPIGPLLEVSAVANDLNHPISDLLKKVISSVPEEMIGAVLENSQFRGRYGRLNQKEQKWFAREWVIIDELNRRIHSHRQALLLGQDAMGRPAPYDEPALVDLPLTLDKLVPLSEFDIEGGVLLRNGRAFIVLPPTPSENSSYWITRALDSSEYRNQTFVRLDPLIRGDDSGFPRMFYRMLWWGPPLLWKDVENIDKEDFGRWAPGPLSNRSEFTDFAWCPRGEELHLFLEEVPKRADISIRGSRYFHVILSRVTSSVVHFDAATRIYSEDEWDSRYGVHVHRTGKVGKRVKVFRIDGHMAPDEISNLGGTFFVWNDDVSHFFGSAIPPSLLGGA